VLSSMPPIIESLDPRFYRSLTRLALRADGFPLFLSAYS
jgi:hypothetical protein